MNTIFISVAGGCSAKPPLTEHLAERFGSNISVVHHDNYYKRQDCSLKNAAARITTTRCLRHRSDQGI